MDKVNRIKWFSRLKGLCSSCQSNGAYMAVRVKGIKGQPS